MISRLKNPESSGPREEITSGGTWYAREKERDRERDKENCGALVRGVREWGEKERQRKGKKREGKGRRKRGRAGRID